MTVCFCYYRSVPLIHPPILYTASCPKRGGGIFLSTQFVSIIRPLKKFALFKYVHMLQKYKRSPVLFVVIMRGLPSYIGEKSCHFDSRAITFTTPSLMSLWPSSRTAILSVMNHRYFLRKSGSEVTCTVGVNGDAICKVAQV